MSGPDAYPLAWPEGWPRTPASEQKTGDRSFKRQQDSGRGWRQGEPWTFGAARDALLEEVFRHIGGANMVLSSNFNIGRNGPMEGRRRPADQAIALYFNRFGKPHVIACDRYVDAEGNMRSITLALEAMRALERHGGGVMMEKAFAGFVALPAPKKPHEILGVPVDATVEEIRTAWKFLVSGAHPDRGGSEAWTAELNAARDDMLRGKQ